MKNPVIWVATLFLLMVWPASAQELKLVVREKGGGQPQRELVFELRDGARAGDWTLGLKDRPVADQPDARDYRLTWTRGANGVGVASVAVVFDCRDWSAENFVFVPAAVYDGNRFDIKPMAWPPYWHDKKEWRLDMPTTMAAHPTLGKGSGPGRIRLNTGNASVPLVGFHSPAQQLGWMAQTTQGSRFGNHELLIEEPDVARSCARFEIRTPAASWKGGDAVIIRLRVYRFAAKQRADFLQRFSEVRQDLNPAVRNESLPYSAAWDLLNELYQKQRWNQRTGIYQLGDPSRRKQSWFFIWQLGWVGGGQATLPFLLRGDESARQRALSTLDFIFAKSQAASGFYNASSDGEHFASFSIFQNFKYHECLVRSQGDWLYMAQRQFRQVENAGGKVPPAWIASLKKQADAFARLWDKRGQFGQFVDVETGDLCIGGSTSGGIVPGGMALASQTFHEARFLAIAEASARKYYHDFVQRGYTTGGPGEILSAPDSESAFGLFESFVTLYEITGQAEWLRYAKELLPICASWTVAYDYEFPPQSALGRIHTHSCGAVWASVANKHGMPGIVTWSGDSLLKYFRATGDKRALALLTDIAHGITQYISRPDRRIGTMPPGGICERVNLSDWEGTGNIGGNIFGSCSWCETEVLLTVTQLPGLYVQPDTGIIAAFDNIRVEPLRGSGHKLKLRLINPTLFPAAVSVLVESSQAARHSANLPLIKALPIVQLAPGAMMEVAY